MRRIARLRKPAGWLAPSSRCPVASLSRAQSAAASTSAGAPLPTASRTAATTRLDATVARQVRFYSAKPGSLPASLADQPEPGVSAPEDQLAALEEAELLEEEAGWTDAIPYRLPPNRHPAERPDAVSDPSYTPAETSDGLASVGGLENWWDRPENRAEGSDFASFRARRKVQHPDVLETAVRRAVVEATALRMVGREGDLVGSWPIGTDVELESVLAQDVQLGQDGAAVIAGDFQSVARGLTADTEAAETDSAVPMPSTKEAAAYLEKWDSSWRRIPLADPRIKFAVTKRVFQLTGQLIPDHKLSDIHTVAGLLAAVKTPPKAKTLSQDIQKTKQDLVSLPNLAFSPKRVTRADKAKAVGQYKIIEEELAKRDLQHGPLSVPPSREKHYFKGSA
ncbi:hypothetical protein JX265_010819 [Neoarthrinium moseri]|uniref:Large ribosomal subunit protein mL50 n=1 Tax=Neoarthrinium moseri TaxID=1658444 RepID=A0A9Q0AK68_9PEZI|nr:hypothetical protein JX266_011949 [Neoarthrinium moseri]KAI1858151.1 hypothetical protein JX265_010819 [Neoarthrinium moseri]